MCIAIVKPKGIDLPSEQILTNCFENNPDGAGIAFNCGNKVIIKKGMMNLKQFLDTIKEYNKKYRLKDKTVLIHTRITTQGGTNPEMTHPFPIVADESSLKKSKYVSDYAVIHNGIIDLTSDYLTKQKEKTMSDTAIFIRDYLTKIASNSGWFYNKVNIELIHKLIDSKMAILNGKGEVIMTEGFTEDKGIFYSNSSYKDNYTKYSRYSSFVWDDDGLDDWEKDPTTNIWKKKDNSKKTKKRSIIPTTSVMDVKPYQVICLDDGTIMDNMDMTNDKYFITKDGEIYGWFGDYSSYCGYQYVGDGRILDSQNFKEVTWAKTTSIVIDSSDYDY